jgi:glycosyltransferase involved in cell wall biosynthesis
VPGVVQQLAEDQVARGWEVGVAAPRPLGGRWLEWNARRSPGPWTLTETLALGRAIRRFHPDIVHLHSAKAGLCGRLWLRGSTPTVFQPHAWSFEAVEGLVRRASLAWERAAARWTHACVCVSEAERERGETSGIRCRYRVIPNGVDTSAFTPRDRDEARARLGLDDAPLAVCVARLSRQKGQDLLVAAWPAVRARVPGARLALIGAGELDLPETDGVERLGPRDDVADWYAAANVVVLPSRWEGMSLTMLEAMASGRSVVATDVAGAHEALGYHVVPVEHAVALAGAIVQRLLDPAHADAEGLENRAKAERAYDVSRVGDAVAELYDEVLNSSTRSSTL